MARQLEHSHVHPHPTVITKMLISGGGNSEEQHQQMIRIWEKCDSCSRRYGKGSGVVVFDSVRALQIKKRPQFPSFVGRIPDDCVLDKASCLFFAPAHVLEFIGLTNKEHRSWGRLMTIQVCVYFNLAQNKEIFRSYHSMLCFPNFLDPLLLHQFDRISMTLICEQYPDLMPLFCEKQIKHFDDFFVESEPKTGLPMAFADVLPKEMVSDEDRRLIRRALRKYHREPTRANRKLACAGLFYYLREEKEFKRYLRLAYASQFAKTRIRLLRVMKQLEKRVCGYCKLYLIHNQAPNAKFKAYKWCGRCGSEYYCSRRCQKKHWKKAHRYICPKSVWRCELDCPF